MEYEEIGGDWEAPPNSVRSGFPIPEKQYIKNVRANCLLDLPNLGVQKEHDRIMVMICGGPTAQYYLDEIREKNLDPKYDVICSNKTHDWLIENGIIPKYQFIIDPKPGKVNDIRNPNHDVEYIIGVSCDHAVFQALDGYNVTRAFSVSGLGKPTDMQIVDALFPYQDIAILFGGSMAGLRVMSIADMLGFLTLEYYGFDSCYFDTDSSGDPIYYSYEKERKENILEAKTDDGRTFLTSPVFASQARQFVKWKHRYEWMNFIIHGDSLTSHINDLENEKIKPKHDLLITDYHRTLNKEMHTQELIREGENDVKYGFSGHLYAGGVAVLAGTLVKAHGEVTMLDYGCGKRSLEEHLPPITGLIMYNYDPCIEGVDDTPEPADIVVCTDVLEHIEPECLENVLDDLKRVTKKVCYLAVSTRLANKAYSDGQNTHKIIEEHEWWRPKLKKRFFITDTQVIKGDKFVCVMQSKDLGGE